MICPDDARKCEYIVLASSMMSANKSYLKFLFNLLSKSLVNMETPVYPTVVQ